MSLSTAVVSCGPGPVSIAVPAAGGSTAWSANELSLTYPLPAGENIRAVVLGNTEDLSYHFIQIRDREAPHIHAEHDLVVTLLSGQGSLNMAENVVSMRPGDTALVPRGGRHFFVNTGEQPAAAFVTFVPPHDGTDYIPVD